jgi:hypothetical protein
MSVFNNNKNTFASLLHTLKNDFHAFTSLGVAKGARNERQKKALISNISSAINSIDTTDFGIRVIVVKTKD